MAWVAHCPKEINHTSLLHLTMCITYRAALVQNWSDRKNNCQHEATNYNNTRVRSKVAWAWKDFTRYYVFRNLFHITTLTEEPVKNHQNWTKIVKETLLSEGISNSIQFGLNLRAQTHQRVSLVFCFFWHLLHHWVCVNRVDIFDLRFIFDISVLQLHLAIFFILFKLKPDITCIDLTSKKCDFLEPQWLKFSTATQQSGL